MEQLLATCGRRYQNNPTATRFVVFYKIFHAKYFCTELAVQKYFTYDKLQYVLFAALAIIRRLG